MRQLISYLAKSTLNKLEEIRSRDSSHSGGWYCSFFLQIKAFKGSGLLLVCALVVFHLRRGLVYWSKVLFPRTKYCCQNETIFIFLKTWSLKLRRAAKVGQLAEQFIFFLGTFSCQSFFWIKNILESSLLLNLAMWFWIQRSAVSTTTSETCPKSFSPSPEFINNFLPLQHSFLSSHFFCNSILSWHFSIQA